MTAHSAGATRLPTGARSRSPRRSRPTRPSGRSNYRACPVCGLPSRGSSRPPRRVLTGSGGFGWSGARARVTRRESHVSALGPMSCIACGPRAWSPQAEQDHRQGRCCAQQGVQSELHAQDSRPEVRLARLWQGCGRDWQRAARVGSECLHGWEGARRASLALLRHRRRVLTRAGGLHPCPTPRTPCRPHPPNSLALSRWNDMTADGKGDRRPSVDGVAPGGRKPSVGGNANGRKPSVGGSAGGRKPSVGGTMPEGARKPSVTGGGAAGGRKPSVAGLLT